MSLVEGVRYNIDARWIGKLGINHFSLGVQFPDGSELKPINDAYLYRSMGKV